MGICVTIPWVKPAAVLDARHHHKYNIMAENRVGDRESRLLGSQLHWPLLKVTDQN